MPLRTTGLILSSVIVFATGIWLTRAGKPYGAILLNVHKLLSLVGVVLLALAIRQLAGDRNSSPAQLTSVIVTGLLLLAAIVTGGLASIDRTMPRAVLVAHRITPFAGLVAAAATVYLVIG